MPLCIKDSCPYCVSPSQHYIITTVCWNWSVTKEAEALFFCSLKAFSVNCLIENYILMIIIQFTHYYFTVSLLRGSRVTTSLVLFVHCSHPSLIQSNYAAIHPQANQTFNSLMEPHFIIGLCSETNKQSSSRLVIPLTATYAELVKLAANKVKKKQKKTFEEFQPLFR